MKKILSILLTLALLAAMLPVFAVTVSASSNLESMLDEDDKVMDDVDRKDVESMLDEDDKETEYDDKEDDGKEDDGKEDDEKEDDEAEEYHMYAVGQWVRYLNRERIPNPKSFYDLVIDVFPNQRCSVVSYCYDYDIDSLGPATLDTYDECEFATVSRQYEVNIPEVVLERAEQDLAVYASTGRTLSLGGCVGSMNFSYYSGKLFFGGRGVVPADAFQGLQNIHSIVVGEGISSIPAGAFSGCTNLKDVTVKGDCKIDNDAFKGIQSVALHVPFAYLQNYSGKYGAADLTVDIYCGDGLKADIQNGNLKITGRGNICANAFLDNDFDGLRTLEIGEGVTGIGDLAFAATELNSAKIPKTVEYIGNSAFFDCPELITVTIDSGNLKTIGDEAFDGCKKLSQITIPAGVESIGDRCFAYSGLKHITFSGDCRIGADAFFRCGWYDDPLKITVPSNWTQGTDVWYGEYGDATYEFAGNGTASVFSEGNLTTVCIIAAAVVLGLGGFIIGKKKKKSALASGTETTNEE